MLFTSLVFLLCENCVEGGGGNSATPQTSAERYVYQRLALSTRDKSLFRFERRDKAYREGKNRGWQLALLGLTMFEQAKQSSRSRAEKEYRFANANGGLSIIKVDTCHRARDVLLLRQSLRSVVVRQALRVRREQGDSGTKHRGIAQYRSPRQSRFLGKFFNIFDKIFGSGDERNDVWIRASVHHTAYEGLQGYGQVRELRTSCINTLEGQARNRAWVLRVGRQEGGRKVGQLIRAGDSSKGLGQEIRTRIRESGLKNRQRLF